MFRPVCRSSQGNSVSAPQTATPEPGKARLKCGAFRAARDFPRDPKPRGWQTLSPAQKAGEVFLPHPVASSMAAPVTLPFSAAQQFLAPRKGQTEAPPGLSCQQPRRRAHSEGQGLTSPRRGACGHGGRPEESRHRAVFERVPALNVRGQEESGPTDRRRKGASAQRGQGEGDAAA